MSSYRQILYHIVIRTKKSWKTLPLIHGNQLYTYMIGVIRKKNCFIYCINGMEEHIHILSDLHPGIALSDYIRDLKTSSSIWLKQNKDFPDFVGWGSGYAGLTYSYRERNIIINYIKNQKKHHIKEDFETEYRRLIEEQGITIDEKYFP